MELTLGEIASQLGAILDGDPAIRITNAGTLRESEAGYLTIAESAKYLDLSLLLRNLTADLQAYRYVSMQPTSILLNYIIDRF